MWLNLPPIDVQPPEPSCFAQALAATPEPDTHRHRSSAALESAVWSTLRAADAEFRRLGGRRVR